MQVSLLPGLIEDIWILLFASVFRLLWEHAFCGLWKTPQYTPGKMNIEEKCRTIFMKTRISRPHFETRSGKSLRPSLPQGLALDVCPGMLVAASC